MTSRINSERDPDECLSIYLENLHELTRMYLALPTLDQIAWLWKTILAISVRVVQTTPTEPETEFVLEQLAHISGHFEIRGSSPHRSQAISSAQELAPYQSLIIQWLTEASVRTQSSFEQWQTEFEAMYELLWITTADSRFGQRPVTAEVSPRFDHTC
jgi:hypothetical protein